MAITPIPDRTVWRPAPVLALIVAVFGVLLLYRDTAASIVSIWIRSETFAHGFVVIPVSIWFAWRNREALAQQAATPWWPGLAFVFAAGALWLVMSVADVLGLQQFALAFMLQAGILTVVGLRVGRLIAFPLAFLLFAVPVGEFLVPPLIEWTANFTVAALRASGVPVYREGNYFLLPTGAWLVAEACSGVRYLIASIVVGTIYAAVAYRSLWRRALFLLAAVLVPIVANWLRAYMIVMIGHLSDNEYAVGVDHLIYGWIFFGVVMLLLFWVGSLWQEPAQPAPVRSARGADGGVRPSSHRRRLLVAAVMVVAVAGMWRPIAAGIDRKVGGGVPILAAVAGADGWTATTAPFAAVAELASWTPRYLGYTAELRQSFAKDGREVGLYVAYYRQQERGRELVTSRNVIVTSEDWRWKQVARSMVDVEWNGQPIGAESLELAGPAVDLEVLRLYWVQGRVTASPYVAKARLAWSRLFGGGDDAALIVAYTPKPASRDDTKAVLRQFLQGVSPNVDRMLNATREASQ